jgi:hypothetical protein
MSRYHGEVDLAREVFSDWQGAEAFFRDFGLICRADAEGRLYPYSNTANSVLDALRAACSRTTFVCDSECGKLPKGIVIAATGNDMTLLEKHGHRVVEPRSALAPIMTDSRLTRSLKGLRVRAVAKVVAYDNVIKSEAGEVQFGEDFLSGICIMNLARFAHDYRSAPWVSLDVAPEFTLEELRNIPLSGLFHSRIAAVLAKEPLETIKDWRFPIMGVAPLSKAQIMAGGVPASELTSGLQSRRRAGLYVIGEAVNVDGDCGGYNLEWAWASAARAVKDLLASNKVKTFSDRC